MTEEKKYLSIFNDGTKDYHIKDAEAREQIQELEEQLVLETEGGVDTLFDTSYDSENEMIVFGNGCAEYEAETDTIVIEGAVEGDTVVVS